jgi:hypothetical protein
VPIALLDQPLPFGLALTALGLSLHAEGIGQWDAATVRIGLDPSLYIGWDLTIQLAWNRYSLPLGIGVAARIDATNPGAFDVASDLRLYFLIGFDSFGSFAKNGQALGARAAPLQYAASR